MRVYVQVKQLGKRKCNIEKIPVDFPVPPVDVQGLIEAIVSWLAPLTSLSNGGSALGVNPFAPVIFLQLVGYWQLKFVSAS